MKTTATLGALAAALLLAGCATQSAPPQFRYTPPPDQPEGSSGYSAKPGWATQKFAVAAANPLATDAGYQVLKAGGSAIDAVIAVQMVLTLVEPQSSGIGGGAFLMHYNGKNVEAFDGRETAPAGVNEFLFIGPDRKPMQFYDAVVGGRSVGTPGTLRVLELAHKQYGKLPWAALFEPAIRLAEGGFKVSARLNTLAQGDAHLKKDPTAAAYFFQPDGKAVAVGSTLRNPELAAVLKRIAAEGRITCLMVTHNIEDALKTGSRTLMMDAGRVVFDVKGEERSRMTVDDLLEKFRENAGKALDNDRILLSDRE